jgi:N6-L-threonylcarbamoyladenine synthase
VKPILGIETSCDETAAAVLDGDGSVLSELVLSQVAEHLAYGGVVPEIAARAHLQYLPTLVERAMSVAGVRYEDLAGVAATNGPGLIGGLIVGSQVGKGIALAHDLPFFAINHLEAHALTARLPQIGADANFPYLILLLSGGHSQCLSVTGLGRYERLGGTIDDAIGEAFDKVAKLLNLGWPGGPALEAKALQGDPARYQFPRPLLRREGCDFSFSGLKTAVAQTVRRIGSPAGERETADVAASFQAAVVEVLTDRATNACRMMRERHPDANLAVIAGGVAANKSVRDALSRTVAAFGFRFAAPPPRLCSDNAVMVAWAGLEHLCAGGPRYDFSTKSLPRWPLTSLSP